MSHARRHGGPDRRDGGAVRRPALAAYVLDPRDGVHCAYGVMVFACEGDTIAGIVGFADVSLFAASGLPPEQLG